MTSNYVRYELPINRSEIEKVRIIVQQAEVSKLFPTETEVTFSLGGKDFHGWMPRHSVNIDRKWLKAMIVGDFDNGDWEIHIPDETLESTKVLRVPTVDQETTVIHGWW